LSNYESVAARIKKSGRPLPSADDGQKLLDPALRFIPGRNKRKGDASTFT